MSRLRQLGKDSLVYGIGAVVAKGLGVLLLPIYTRIFSPADYGTIEMLTVITSLLSSVMFMGMDAAQSMFFFKARDEGKAAQALVVSAILQWRLCWGSAIVLVATLSAPFISAQLFDGRLGWEFFAVAFGSALVTQVLSQSIDVLRLLYRPWPYILISLAQSVTAAASVLAAVLVFDQGIFGYFLGNLIAASVAAAIGWITVREYLDFSSVHLQAWPRLLRFGGPLMVADLSYYVMSTTDRWFIQHYHNEAVLGIYAIGAKFALLMSLVIETFRKAWWPIAMDAMHSADGPETYRRIARLFIGLAAAGVVGLTFLAPWLVKLIAPPDFYDAWTIVGVLAWQSVFDGFSKIAGAGIWKAEKTQLFNYLAFAFAIVNVALNGLLVPCCGGIGAAMATSLTYLAWVVTCMVISERLWKVNFPFAIIVFQIGLSCLLVFWLTVVKQGVYDWTDALLTAASISLLCGVAFDRSTRSAICSRLRAQCRG